MRGTRRCASTRKSSMQVIADTISLSAGTDDEYTFSKRSLVILGVPGGAVGAARCARRPDSVAGGRPVRSPRSVSGDHGNAAYCVESQALSGTRRIRKPLRMLRPGL